MLDVRINEDGPGELFAMQEAKPGAIEAFDDGSYRQILAGGYDHMDEITDWIQRNVKHERPVWKVSGTEIVCHIAVFLISVYITYWCWKSRCAQKVRVQDWVAGSVL